MKLPRLSHAVSICLLGGIAIGISGCKNRDVLCREVAPQGAISDAVWQQQEENAEASDFIVHESEFVGNSIRLNLAGEDHLKQIAVRAKSAPFPIVVERSTMSVAPESQYGFPVNNDPQLDLKRRELVVRALDAWGVKDANERVVVAPVYSPGFEIFEAQRAYNRGFSGSGFGGVGGFGGGGGGGGFGGGGF